MEKGISYINRTFDDYKDSLIQYTKKYYPELEKEFNDASIGSWLLDIVSNIGDNLSYHIDRVYQETNIESANEKESIYSLAKNNNVKIPGPKASLVEVTFSCEIPVDYANGSSSEMRNPDWDYAPVIKKGTKLSTGNQIFELMEDVDFQQQFNENGISNRLIKPKRNSNNIITKYEVTKTGIASASETRVFTKEISDSDITPFMSIIIPDENVINIESIIVKDGINLNSQPTSEEFFTPLETNVGLSRFFEVDYLSQQYKWGDNDSEIFTTPTDDNNSYNYCIRKGLWIPLRQKFITEFTDKGYLKVIFGAGNETTKNTDYSSLYTDKTLITELINNDGLGVLPNPNTTMYIMYRKGGGNQTNVAVGAIKNISYLKIELRGSSSELKSEIKRTIKVTNNAPGVSGKDAPSEDEIKYLIKYNNGAQDRCVTLKDYHDRISKLPARYGCPFRYSVTEENNKIMIYTLGINNQGKLTNIIPSVLLENLRDYLSGYKMINDYIEIKPGNIINLRFFVNFFVDKNYNTSNVVTNVIECIKKYMDISKNQMGDDIFVGDIEKEISKIDGVSNLISLKVANIFDGDYSSSKTLQPIEVRESEEDVSNTNNMNFIDLKNSDKMLYSENDTMFEIRFPETDIICQVKQR